MTSRGTTLIDPVCGRPVKFEASSHETMYDGEVVVFCAEECKAAFGRTPGVLHSKLVALKRRAIVSGLLSAAMVAVGIAPDEGLGLGERTRAVLLFGLATPVLFFCGASLFRGLGLGRRRWSSNNDGFIAMGAGVAYGCGALATLSPRFLLSAGVVPGPYFVSAAWIVTLVLLGKLLEAKIRGRASALIDALAELQPPTARLVAGNVEREIPVAKAQVGDVLSVLPGERVPLDGIIREGDGSIVEAAFTGERTPVDKRAGDWVTGGAVNEAGAFRLEVTCIAEETTLARILRVVRRAQGSRSPAEELVGRSTSVFVPAVVGIAAITFLVWLWLGPRPALPFALDSAIGVLIIAGPCAIGQAIRTAIVVATTRAAGMGIVFQSAEALEHLSAVQDLVLDKTGTITEGTLRVTDVLSVSEHDTRDLVALTASAEKASEHPTGQAIVSHAHGIGVVVPNPSEFEALPGRGVRARVRGMEVLVGNARLLSESGIDGGRLLDGARHLAAEGKSAIFVVADGEKQGIIGVLDTLKNGSVDAVARMKIHDLRPLMLTGDSAAVASRIGASVGIEDVLAEVIPRHEAREVEKLRGTGRKVAVVGGGKLDASALAGADVGLSIGNARDISIGAPDVTLVRDDLNAVVDAILLARATRRVTRQNLGWVLFYNLLGVPVAAGLLYPFFGVLLSPVVAAGAMAVSSVLVVANALRLIRFEPGS